MCSCVLFLSFSCSLTLTWDRLLLDVHASANANAPLPSLLVAIVFETLLANR